MKKSTVENLLRAKKSLGAAIIIQALDDCTRKTQGNRYEREYQRREKRQAKDWLKSKAVELYSQYFGVPVNKDYLRNFSGKDYRRYRTILQRFQYAEDKEGHLKACARKEQGMYKKIQEA
jgi:hypothetical protein